jgi:hypothetical protein
MECKKYDVLIAEEIRDTIHQLYLRIKDRFPQSGLSKTCYRLYEISLETHKMVEWIIRPQYGMRFVIDAFIAVVAIGVVLTIAHFKISADGLNISDVIQMVESGMNGLLLIGAGVVFLVTYETRIKRQRVINAVNKLKCIAHIIDAHQLTKDPDTVSSISVPTQHSPMRSLDSYSLGRYLDYCTEMLSLTSKLGFLYIQGFPDPVASSAVDELEGLTTGLSRKIWQKIMILRNKQ